MLDNTPSELGNKTLSNGPLFQWLGVQWQGAHYAVSLNSISAVFKTNASDTARHTNQPLDVAVHEGAVVFMKAFSECFTATPGFDITTEQPQWVIVLRSSLASAIGCRVQSVVGPFWAKSGLPSLEHDGQQWAVVYQAGDAHA